MFVPQRAYRLAHRLDIFAFGARDPGVIVDLLAPGLVGKARLELPAVVFGEFGLKARERGTLERRGTCRPGEVWVVTELSFDDC